MRFRERRTIETSATPRQPTATVLSVPAERNSHRGLRSGSSSRTTSCRPGESKSQPSESAVSGVWINFAFPTRTETSLFGHAETEKSLRSTFGPPNRRAHLHRVPRPGGRTGRTSLRRSVPRATYGVRGKPGSGRGVNHAWRRGRNPKLCRGTELAGLREDPKAAWTQRSLVRTDPQARTRSPASPVARGQSRRCSDGP